MVVNRIFASFAPNFLGRLAGLLSPIGWSLQQKLPLLTSLFGCHKTHCWKMKLFERLFCCITYGHGFLGMVYPLNVGRRFALLRCR